MKKYDVVVIGAGPAGIIAAITASSLGKAVLLLDKNAIIGRKILATGNGRCNLTNRLVSADRYHGANGKFIKSVLMQFDQHMVMDFFESLGLLLKEEDNGRIFPRTNQAASVVNVLVHELEKHDVKILLDSVVKRLEHACDWMIVLESGEVYACDALVLATGGKAGHAFGSSGDGLYWAEKLGHKITPINAALVPVETNNSWPKEVSGLKINGRAAVRANGAEVSAKIGDILFTHYGLSGPAIMAQARIVAPLLQASSGVTISIDLFDDLDGPSLEKKMIRVFSENGTKTIKNALAGVLPSNLIPIILRISLVDPDKKAAIVSKSERSSLLRTMKNLRVSISKTRPFKEAQVTSGGVDISLVDGQKLESKIVPGLFFAGEILDVDGDSGGFNLQWAWSSGHVAGKNAALSK